MTPIDGLPEGLTARPLTLDDAEAVTAVVAAEEVIDLGEPEVTVEDVLSDWLRPSYDITASTLGVFDGDLLVAYGDLSGPDIGYTAVLPAYQGRGIGTAIARWMQATARAAGSPRIGTQVPEGSAADRLLTGSATGSAGPRGTSSCPRTARSGPPAARRVHGPGRRGGRPGGGVDAAGGRVPRVVRPGPDEPGGLRRPDLGPPGLRAVEPPPPGLADGQLVGATHVFLADDGGYVARIAVRPDHRGRGLAPPMLVDAFGLAREHGAVRCYLSTDTRAGARGLYEKVGMEVASTWVNRAIAL